MLVHGILSILLLAQVQGHFPQFKGPGDDFTAYGGATTVTKTATFTFTSAVRTVDAFVTELNTVLKTYNVQETIYQKDTVTKTVVSTLTLTDFTLEPLVSVNTAKVTTISSVTSEVTVGQIIREEDTRTRTLMHWSHNLVKNTHTRTTTITDKYQIIQMQTTLQTVTIPITVTVTISNTVYQPTTSRAVSPLTGIVPPIPRPHVSS